MWPGFSCLEPFWTNNSSGYSKQGAGSNIHWLHSSLLAVGREPDQPVMSFTTQARAEKDATPVDQAAVA